MRSGSRPARKSIAVRLKDISLHKETTLLVTTLDKKTESRDFYKLLFRTVLPLLIQAVFMQSINFIDQIMISSIGTDAIAAIGASNKALSIYNSFLYGSCSASAMFLAQYWGKKDISGFQKVLGINITSAAIVGTLMAVFVGLAPSLVLKLFNADASVMAYGIDYLRYLVPSYILMGLTFPLNFALRSMNKVKVTMTSTIISVIVNICVNYVLIFGKLGFAPMGVKGAAIGTVVTRLVEFIVLAVYFGLSDNPILKKDRQSIQIQYAVCKVLFFARRDPYRQ